ncbi:DUF5679 domain-containing protein [Nitrososphaera sp. AFS]|uniref:DUF5679 domain-containing protein n=1 Tax=Nitrososphaera sp. AFS TaxID=2301191 RepID=UPI00191740E7|nr:DUF5679 domain-containing protein [Nitrososphaera sp. AFS]
MTTQAYCVKCRSKRDMKDEKLITMKNGQRAISGICTVCGTKMFGGKKVAKVKAASRKQTVKTSHVKGKSTQRRK